MKKVRTLLTTVLVIALSVLGVRGASAAGSTAENCSDTSHRRRAIG